MHGAGTPPVRNENSFPNTTTTTTTQTAQTTNTTTRQTTATTGGTTTTTTTGSTVPVGNSAQLVHDTNRASRAMEKDTVEAPMILPQSDAMKAAAQRRQAIADSVAARFKKASQAEQKEIVDKACSDKLKGLKPRDAVWRAAVAHIRHQHTEYEALLAQGRSRARASMMVTDPINQVLGSWGSKDKVDFRWDALTGGRKDIMQPDRHEVDAAVRYKRVVDEIVKDVNDPDLEESLRGPLKVLKGQVGDLEKMIAHCEAEEEFFLLDEGSDKAELTALAQECRNVIAQAELLLKTGRKVIRTELDPGPATLTPRHDEGTTMPASSEGTTATTTTITSNATTIATATASSTAAQAASSAPKQTGAPKSKASNAVPPLRVEPNLNREGQLPAAVHHMGKHDAGGTSGPAKAKVSSLPTVKKDEGPKPGKTRPKTKHPHHKAGSTKANRVSIPSTDAWPYQTPPAQVTAPPRQVAPPPPSPKLEVETSAAGSEVRTTQPPHKETAVSPKSEEPKIRNASNELSKAIANAAPGVTSNFKKIVSDSSVNCTSIRSVLVAAKHILANKCTLESVRGFLGNSYEAVGPAVESALAKIDADAKGQPELAAIAKEMFLSRLAVQKFATLVKDFQDRKPGSEKELSEYFKVWFGQAQLMIGSYNSVAMEAVIRNDRRQSELDSARAVLFPKPEIAPAGALVHQKLAELVMRLPTKLADANVLPEVVGAAMTSRTLTPEELTTKMFSVLKVQSSQLASTNNEAFLICAALTNPLIYRLERQIVVHARENDLLPIIKQYLVSRMASDPVVVAYAITLAAGQPTGDEQAVVRAIFNIYQQAAEVWDNMVKGYIE